jgi:hypothetical protein
MALSPTNLHISFFFKDTNHRTEEGEDRCLFDVFDETQGVGWGCS